MIIPSLCNTCFQPFELRLEPGDRHLLVQLVPAGSEFVPCPRHCGGQINIVKSEAIEQVIRSHSLSQPLVLTALELYQAVNGLPLPDELPRDRTVLLALLKGSRLDDVVVEERDGRFYLHELVLGNGAVVHLAAGSGGAQVLKVTKERS